MVDADTQPSQMGKTKTRNNNTQTRKHKHCEFENIMWEVTIIATFKDPSLNFEECDWEETIFLDVNPKKDKVELFKFEFSFPISKMKLYVNKHEITRINKDKSIVESISISHTIELIKINEEIRGLVFKTL